MPEDQASSSELPPSHSPDPDSDRDATAPPPPETAKRTYLSLLPPPQLIDLILAIDANRQTTIFPHDLDSAIKALQRPHKPLSPPAVKPEHTTISPAPPVQPPQYTPPTPYYPYSHTPYYPPRPVVQRPQPPPPRPQNARVPPPSAPPRNPLFTSVPLMRDPNKPPPPPQPLHPPVSTRDDPNAMPSYEEMIVEAILDVADADGTAPKVLFSWMASHYPLQQNFRPSASQALHKALKRGRLEKIGGKYRLNPAWGGGPTTSKRATRRPTASRGISPHTRAAHPHPPPPHMYGQAHPLPTPYGFPPYMHPALVPLPHASAPPAAAEDQDGVDSEDMDGEDDQQQQQPQQQDEDARMEGASGKMNASVEEIRSSLVVLAEVLRRIAGKDGARGDVHV